MSIKGNPTFAWDTAAIITQRMSGSSIKRLMPFYAMTTVNSIRQGKKCFHLWKQADFVYVSNCIIATIALSAVDQLMCTAFFLWCILHDVVFVILEKIWFVTIFILYHSCDYIIHESQCTLGLNFSYLPKFARRDQLTRDWRDILYKPQSPPQELRLCLHERHSHWFNNIFYL